MSKKLTTEQKKLSSWPGLGLHEKVEQWLRDNKSNRRLEWDRQAGHYVLLHKLGPSNWGEAATFASLSEFARAEGIE